MTHSITGVLLLNMGGPERLDDIPAFLYNLFADRAIIRLGPAPLQKPLAWLISRRRAPKSRQIYATIGGGSPLRKITEAQAKSLEEALAGDGAFAVRAAMRYWQPDTTTALASLMQHGVQKIIALPLYPHYSRATTGSSLAELRRAHHRLAEHVPLREISSWPDEPHYVKALAARIQDGCRRFNDEPFQLVYSAHSLPVSFIDEGDPYVEELRRTISAIEARTGIRGRLCYQSRSGPVQWLAPATQDMLSTLAAEGCKHILMVPISFVSDHVETLYEIDILFARQARELGMRLISTDALNTSPLFIEGLRTLVLTEVAKAG